MIDMAQADRTLWRTERLPDTRKPKVAPDVKPGDYCVIRGYSGWPTILRIEPQDSYKEWQGCFVYLGEQD
jgi:hypothetical protein